MAVERLAYSPAEAGSALGKSRQWVHDRLADGTINSVKVEGSRLIPAAELNRLLGVQTMVRESRAEQGLPLTVTDPAILDHIARAIESARAGGDAA